MKKAMIPIKARPPATDIPTIDPVPSPLVSSSSLAALVLDWVGAVLVAELVFVTICVTSPVLVTVVAGGGVLAGGGVSGGGVVC